MKHTNIERAAFGFRPLYAQVRDVLMSRLIDGVWKPGSLIPSEIELAREMAVSQGTVRKALDSMTAENLLVRRQGRGTFVAEMEEETILFHYFRLQSDDSSQTKNFPESKVLSVERREGLANETKSLDMKPGDFVWDIERCRHIDGKAVILETIIASQKHFPDLGDQSPLPNNLYSLYSDIYGKTIGKAEEKLKAVVAEEKDTKHLGCPAGFPLLLIERIGYGLDGEPLELRYSRCLTDNLHYANTLR